MWAMSDSAMDLNTALRQVVLLNRFVEQANRPLLSLWHDLFNKPHDGATQFCIFDAPERLYQSQASDVARESAT
jgi:hypothetical protein